MKVETMGTIIIFLGALTSLILWIWWWYVMDLRGERT
jgi:hypothetical protein